MAAMPETPGRAVFRVYRAGNKSERRRWDELSDDDKQGWESVAKFIESELEVCRSRYPGRSPRQKWNKGKP